MSARLVARIGAVVYLGTLLIVPLAQPSTDVLRTHPEDYASGSAGILVNAGYVALAVSLLAIALVSWRERARTVRIGALGLVAAAITCGANALDPTLATRGSPIELGVFGLVVGPALLSLRGRSRAVRLAGALVVVGFLALLASPAAMGGITNRVFDGLVALWCLASAGARARGGIMRASGEVA